MGRKKRTTEEEPDAPPSGESEPVPPPSGEAEPVEPSSGESEPEDEEVNPTAPLEENAEMLNSSIVAPVATRHPASGILERDPEEFAAKPESPDRGE